MKIYFGNNKKESKQVTLKQLMIKLLKVEHTKINHGKFSDDSASWIEVRKIVDKNVVDIELLFDVTTDNTIIDVQVWNTKYVIDEENNKRLI